MLKSDIDRINGFFGNWSAMAPDEVKCKGQSVKYIADSLEWDTEKVNVFMPLLGMRKLELAENTYWFEARAFKVVSQAIEAYLQRED